MKEELPESPPPESRKRLGWLRREGIDLGDAIVQFFSVLLGVLLALLINRWNTQRQEQAAARAAMRQQQAEVHEAMQAIRVELAANRGALHAGVVQLNATAKRMLDAPANQKQSPRPCYMWQGFVSGGGQGIFVQLTDAAYQTAITTQAMAHMSFRQAHSVAEIYSAQHVFGTGSGLIRNKILAGSPQNLEMCILWMESLGYSDRLLSNAYAAIIGPDKTKWPEPPIPIPTKASK